MNAGDRRKYPRYETTVDVTIHTGKLSIPGVMRDISMEGIGIVSKKRVIPGAGVFITLNLESRYIIQGSVMWASDMYDDQSSLFIIQFFFFII